MNLNKLKQPSDLPAQFWIVTLVAFINSVSFTLIIPIIYPYAQQFQLNDFQARWDRYRLNQECPDCVDHF